MSDISLFESYEEEFTDLRSSIEGRIRNIPTYEGGLKRNEVQKAEAELRELDQIIRKMNLSGRSNARLVPKIREYELEVTRLKTAIRKADMQVSQTQDRNELFSGVKLDDVMSGSMSQRERLIGANERLDSASSDIEYANQMAQEAVGHGIVALESLDDQSNKMRRMREDLEGIDTSLNRAKRVMRQIARRAWANKIILAIVALVMIAIICLVIYFKFFPSSSSSSGTGTTTTTGDLSSTGSTNSSSTTGTTQYSTTADGTTGPLSSTTQRGR